MTIKEIVARKAQIADEIKAGGLTEERVAELEAERRKLDEEFTALETEIAGRQAANARAFSNGVTIGVLDNPKSEEITSTRKYAEAFLTGLKTGDYSEARALLSTNGTNSELSLTGYVPVPEELEGEIKTAWEKSTLMSLVKKSYFKGNVKISFELTADGANIHLEGDSAPSEENVTLGIVELKADTIKKWITVSDVALEGTTVDTIGYIYKEIAQRIVEKAEEILIQKIMAAPTTATATACGVPVLAENTPAADTIVKALALLTSSAKNLYLVMNRSTYPVFRALELNGNYAFDVFEGLRDRIVFTDKIDSYSVASAKTAAGTYTYAIVGDFGNGAQANYPNGDSMSLIVDNLSLAEKDLVKIVGKEYAGIGVVADKHFVKIAFIKN